MRNMIKQVLIGVLGFSMICLFVGCHELSGVKQPSVAQPGETISSRIIVHVDTTGGLVIKEGRLFLMLPMGWSVPDTIKYTGIAQGQLVYSETLVDSVNTYMPSTSSHYWWVGGLADSAVVNEPGLCTIETPITVGTDVGSFTIQYGIGTGNTPAHRERTGIIISPNTDELRGDIFVAPTGSIGATGNYSDPIKTISEALGRVSADSLNPATIHLAAGEYSPVSNGECFPLRMVSSVTIKGLSLENTIISADSTNRIFNCFTVKNCTIANTTIMNGRPVKKGGGIYCEDSQITINAVRICNNDLEGLVWEYSGGGLCAVNSNVSLNHVLMDGNYAPGCGCHSKSYGAGIYCENSSLLIINCTISGNTGYGNIFFGNHLSKVISPNNDLTIVNTILGNDDVDPWHTPYHIVESDSTKIRIAFSNILGGQEAVLTFWGEWADTWIEGNIDSLPRFAKPDSGNFHLQGESPCIDAGTAFFVLDGDTLVNFMPNEFGGQAPDMGAFEYSYTTGVNESSVLVPRQANLKQNYPNPFNPATTIRYYLPEQTQVNLTVYDVMGREVNTLQNLKQPAGHYEVQWRGADELDNPVSTGVYFARLQAGDYSKTIKMVYLK